MMNDWPKVRLGEIYDIPSSNGLSRPSAVRGEGYRMINMGELFAHDIISDIEMERVKMSDKEMAKFLVKEGDLLFARQSLVAAGAGKCSIIKRVKEPTTFESHLIRVRLNDGYADSWFYYYYFRLPNTPIKGIVNQCAQAGIRGRDLEKIQVPLPPLDIQRAIAKRLSAYDNLIENNTRRIAILENKAEQLYKEWFVRSRFPDHTVTKNSDLPLGTIGEWYLTSSGGTPPRSNPEYFQNGEYMWVKTGELEGRFIIETEERITKEAVEKSAAKIIPSGALLCSMYAGVGKLGFAVEPMTCSQATCVFMPRSYCTNEYLYFFLKENKAYLESISFGAAQQNISQEIIKKIKIPIPEVLTITLFGERVKPMFEMVLNLQRQNALLAKERDLLLPRLMSGRIEVKHV